MKDIIENNKEIEIKMQKDLKINLKNFATKVVGEVVMKFCHTLTIAFRIGC